MRLLLASSLPGFGRSWPALADELIVCGPHEVDLTLGEAVFTRATPATDYDLSAVVAALPAGQKPDLVACVVDGETTVFPRQLVRCAAIRLLLIGDSQSSPDGLARLLAYARSEPFDRIIFTHGGLDEPIFAAAGFQQTFWFPGLLCPVRDWVLPLVRERKKTRAVGAPPETATRYTAGNAALEALGRSNIYPSTWSEEPELRLEEMAHSQVNLVPSERGEWSDSFFEVLATGGSLVTSHLGGGAERLWPEGAPLFQIEQAEDLVAAVHRWLDSPESLDGSRLAAAAWYDAFLGERPRREAFLALALEGRPVVPAVAPCPVDPTPYLTAIPAIHLALESAAGPVAAVPAAAAPGIVALLERFPRMALVRSGLEEATLAVTSGGTTTVAAPLRWMEAPGPIPVGHEPVATSAFVTGDRAFLEAWRTRSNALRALEQGDYPRAIELASRDVTQRPDSVDGHVVIADLFLEKSSAVGFEKHQAILRRLAPHDARVVELARRAITGQARSPRRQLRAILGSARQAGPAAGAAALESQANKNPLIAPLVVLCAELWQRHGPGEAAVAAWTRAARHHPNDDALWFRLGLALWGAGRRPEAGVALRRAADHAPHEAAFGRALAAARAAEPALGGISDQPRNLVISSSENCFRHGVGVLVARYFGKELETVTLRSSTCYDGVEEAGGIHLCLPHRAMDAAELETRLAVLLAPYQVTRILCIPHRFIECSYAISAQDVTGARLCTFVMDDRNILAAPETDDVQMDELFRRSSLRLVISSEMQMAYAIKYNYDFDVLPPTVSNRAARRVNAWNPKTHPATHVALVGNIWTVGQFLQLVKFMARSNLTVDWYGPVPPFELAGTGITPKGSVPESVLADTLMNYPFVLVPSGMLDGTEDNEWLTRLSLPSRCVFLLQAGSPMLALGSQDTCVGRYILDLGVGRTMPYNHPRPQEIIAEMCKPAARAQFARNLAAAADGFVMEHCGDWIWRSLDEGKVAPAPFHAYLKSHPELEILYPPEHAGRIAISHVELAPA